MKRRRDARWIWIAAAGLVVAGLIYSLADILAPFLAAAILAYILDPVVDRLAARRIPRTLATALALLLLLLLGALMLVIIMPLFIKESVMLAEQFPILLDKAKTEWLPWVAQRTGMEISLDPQSLKSLITDNLQDARGIAQRVFNSLRVGGLAVLGFVINLLLVPVVLFYLLRDWDTLVASINDMVPRRWRKKTGEIAGEIDAVLAEFLRGQLSVMLLMSVFYVTGLWLTGLQFALPIGLITGILVFVPYLGSITGFLLATLAALMQFQGVQGVVWVWVVFAIGQMLEGMVVTPWLVGDRVGLHPVAVIFALLAFGQVFGFFGVLLALPASAALLVGLRHLRQRYQSSGLYRH
ncbi:MAG: AI-2E family transporter [Betaproteobacteria bacterium]|nr:AI-2E family transporter [Betaproteobacteria bacterium]